MTSYVKRALLVVMASILLVAFMPALTGNQAMAKSKKPGKVKWGSSKYIPSGGVGYQGNSMYLVWKNAKNAKKYQVYISKNAKKKWKKKKTISAAAYKKELKRYGMHVYRISGFSWNTSYYVKVRAINGKKKGAFSSVYQVNFGSKRTLQNILGANSTGLQAIRDNIEAKTQGLFTGNMSFEGNKAVMTLKCTQNISSTRTAQLFESQFNTSSMRSTMKANKAKLTYIAGVTCSGFELKFYNNDGAYLYSHVY